MRITKDNYYKLKAKIKNNPNKILKIISKIDDTYLKICFTYDIPELREKTLDIYRNAPYSQDMIRITKTLLKEEYIDGLLEIVLDKLKESRLYDNIFDIIVRYLVRNNKDLVNRLFSIDDKHVKYLMITTLLSTDMYSSKTLVDVAISSLEYDDLILLAEKLYISKDEEFERLKNYIITKYPKNSLGFKLLSNPRYVITDEVFSSADNKFQIYEKYSHKLTKDMQERFLSGNPLYTIPGNKQGMKEVYKNLLGENLEWYIEKYMHYSKSREICFLSSGSSSDVYRIGDYVIKLSHQKWSHSDTICPNSYLIAKNYEQDYIRDDENRVIAGIEVQKYLSKEAPEEYESPFRNALKEEGYYVYDALIDCEYGSNLRMLDSYKDADIEDYSNVPYWFFEYPVVLIDRDLVFKIGEKPKTHLYRKNIKIN